MGSNQKTQPTFMLELFAPAFPSKGRFVRILSGSVEEILDTLDPCMLATKEIQIEKKMSRSEAVAIVLQELHRFATENNALVLRDQTSEGL